MPALSVIIPNYNHAKFLPRCFEAIIKQDFQDFEIVVIDDGSTDNSVELIQEFQSKHPTKIKFYRNLINQGVSPAVNRAIEFTEGKYIAFLSADDLILPNFFSAAMNILREHPEAGGCATFQYFYNESDPTKIREMKNRYLSSPTYFSPEEYKKKLREFNCYVYGAGIILKKTSIIQAQGYRDLGACADWLLVFTIAFREGLCILPKPYVVIRQSKDCYSVHAPSGISILPKLLKHFQTNYSDVRDAFFDSLIMLQLGIKIHQYPKYLLRGTLKLKFFKLALNKYVLLKRIFKRRRAVFFIEHRNIDTNSMSLK